MPAKKNDKKAPKRTFSTDWQSHDASPAAIKRFQDRWATNRGTTLTSGSTEIEPYSVTPTGSLRLDEALRVGGWPVGRLIQLYGPEHAGKTTLAILAAREAQKLYPTKMIGWADAEHTFDKSWAARLGLDLSRLWLPEVITAEDCADAVFELTTSGMCSMVVTDSIGGMISQEEFEKDSDDDVVAATSRRVTRMVKQVCAIGSANGTTQIVLNQIRSKIGGFGYGPQISRPGGHALSHASSILAYVRRGGGEQLTVQSKGVAMPVGYEISVKIEKNKVAPWGSVANFYLLNQESAKYGPVGVDLAVEAADYGIELDIIGAKGGWYTVPGSGDKINGKEKVVTYLRDNPQLVTQIREAVVAQSVAAVEEDSEHDFSEMV